MKSDRDLDDELAAEFGMHALAARSARLVHRDAVRASAITGHPIDEEIERARAVRALTHRVATMARYLAANS